MQKSLYIYLLGCFLGNLVTIDGLAAEGVDSETPGGRIRAGYMYQNNLDIPEAMGQNGMNLALVKIDELHAPMLPQERELLLKWAIQCRQAGIRFMPVVNFWRYEKEWIKPRYHLCYGGIELTQTPCPLEADVYNLAIHERVLQLAQLSRSLPIAGVAIDLEMYDADVGAFPDYCLCDYCFQRFSAAPSIEQLPLDKRQDYLVKSGQLDAYRTFTANYIEQLARNTKQQVEAIAPDFLIGALVLDNPSTYCRGLAKGLGNGRKAVLIFTEQTYYTGYSDYIHQTQKRFKDEGINAQLVVGLWQDKFQPENLAEQYYYCAKDSAGYWVYTLQSLSDKTKTALPFDKTQFWQAIEQADKELQKLELDPGYQSALQIRDFQAVPVPLDTSGINIPPLEYVGTADLLFPKPTDSALFFRGKATLVFLAREADELKFKVALQKLGPYRFPTAYVALTDSSGNILTSPLVSLRENVELRTIAPYTGSYALICDPDVNLWRAVSFSHPFNIDMSNTVAVFQPNQSFYFLKPAGSFFAKVAFGVDGFSESVTVTFKDEGGKILGVRDIVGQCTVTVPLDGSSKDEIIELQIQPRAQTHYFEDVRIRVEAGLGKYASLSKENVLKTAN